MESTTVLASSLDARASLGCATCWGAQFQLSRGAKCIPDFIPGIGDADAFIKVPRPDGEEQTLGLTILDEPKAVQSDPGVLELQLRAAAKMNNVKDATVQSVEAADKNPARLTKWMESVAEIQRTRPQPSVQYTHEVPTMETLMQAWPPQMEAALNEVVLPRLTYLVLSVTRAEPPTPFMPLLCTVISTCRDGYIRVETVNTC